MTKPLTRAALTCCTLALAACTSEPPPTALPAPSQPPAAVESPPAEASGTAAEAAPEVMRLLVEPEMLLLGVGQSAQLTATALAADGSRPDVRLTWRTLSPSRIDVDPDGTVRSVGARGPGFVSVSYGDIAVEVPVRVVPESELPVEEPEEVDAGPPEPVVTIRGAEAPAAVSVEAAQAALIGSWATRQADGTERIATFHEDFRLLDDVNGDRRLGRWRIRAEDTTHVRIDMVYDDARHGRGALVCLPPENDQLNCGDRMFVRRT